MVQECQSACQLILTYVEEIDTHAVRCVRAPAHMRFPARIESRGGVRAGAARQQEGQRERDQGQPEAISVTRRDATTKLCAPAW